MKFVVLAFSCLLFLGMPARADDAGTFNAMVTLAHQGDAEAQYHVGMMYNNGIGTQQDRSQAFAWFQKSAAANEPLGAYKLGCYFDGQGAGIVAADADQALKYKLVSARAGYARAQHDVALLYDRQGNPEEEVEMVENGRRSGTSLRPLQPVPGLFRWEGNAEGPVSVVCLFQALANCAAKERERDGRLVVQIGTRECGENSCRVEAAADCSDTQGIRRHHGCGRSSQSRQETDDLICARSTASRAGSHARSCRR
ncbi:sel1 repeat family protein [Bradyrhizobium japonicum]|uniref:tetratricopeptide repeat protein n=1 Tax=Bradyrhizobium japonicum TaxID=375 RepID=UPI001BA51B14|nr:tetratricopeptide repeat protein [Bradyrhizobium japonicum]MBR0991538.1 sel1 repeat family protein [Bradyrhizobium japonicum]